MKSTAYLVNAGRGPIVNEQALVDALKHKDIEGAALDVYEFEPDITEGLKSLDNVVITPHIGNATFEAREMMSKIVANDTIKKLNGEEPQFVVNKNKVNKIGVIIESIVNSMITPYLSFVLYKNLV